MQVSDIAHRSPLGKSDHSVITFKFHCYMDYTKPKEIFSYGKANFTGMRNHLLENKWAESFLRTYAEDNEHGIEDMWGSIKSKIHELQDKFVPKVTTNSKPSWKRRGNIPIDKALQEEIHRKQVFHRKWMKTNSFKWNDNNSEFILPSYHVR